MMGLLYWLVGFGYVFGAATRWRQMHFIFLLCCVPFWPLLLAYEIGRRLSE